jgi:hypothetical protein
MKIIAFSWIEWSPILVNNLVEMPTSSVEELCKLQPWRGIAPTLQSAIGVVAGAIVPRAKEIFSWLQACLPRFMMSWLWNVLVAFAISLRRIFYKTAFWRIRHVT